jgi:hypothetical protein
MGQSQLCGGFSQWGKRLHVLPFHIQLLKKG